MISLWCLIYIPNSAEVKDFPLLIFIDKRKDGDITSIIELGEQTAQGPQTEQLELAKIEEQEKRPTIETLERARPPRSKFKPAVKKGVMMAGFLGLFMFCGLAFLLEMTKKINKDDENTKEFFRNLADIKEDAAKVRRILIGRRRKTPPTKKKS